MSLMSVFPWILSRLPVASPICPYVIIQKVFPTHWLASAPTSFRPLWLLCQFSVPWTWSDVSEDSHIWISLVSPWLHSGRSGLFLLDEGLWVLSLGWMEVSQASVLTVKYLGWLNRCLLICPEMQYQGIPESRWNANEIDPIHLLVAVNSQGLEPVQPPASCWFAGVAELWIWPGYGFLPMCCFGILSAEGVNQILSRFLLRDHLCRAKKSEGDAVK